MTPRQRMLIQSTFEMAMPRLSMVSDRFYTRLLKRKPELLLLFKGDLQSQGRLFTRFITNVIHNLEDSRDVEASLKELGLRHQQYGVEREHYQLASKVFISSVRLATGIHFSYEVHKAWEAFYAFVVDCMAPVNHQSLVPESRSVLHQ